MIRTDYDSVSGFESDDFDLYARDGFEEALNSSMGRDVEICNYDLSERKIVRAIINGRVQDTELNSLSRRMLTKIGTAKAGEYVYFDNRYWIIVGVVDNNGIYEKAVLSLCMAQLTWMNAEGQIVQRWANIISASQYNNGETKEKFMYLRSDQLLITTPDDDECVLLPHGQRFVIDRRTKVYEKRYTPEELARTHKPLITYSLTRMDNVLYDYQDSGHLEFIASEDEQHDEDGYYIIGDKGYWLCREVSENKPVTILSSAIECDEPTVYIGLEPTIFMAKFYNSEGQEIEVTPEWDIDCDFHNELKIEEVENAVMISTGNKKLLNKVFLLSLSADGYETETVEVAVKAFV